MAGSATAHVGAARLIAVAAWDTEEESGQAARVLVSRCIARGPAPARPRQKRLARARRRGYPLRLGAVPPPSAAGPRPWPTDSVADQVDGFPRQLGRGHGRTDRARVPKRSVGEGGFSSASFVYSVPCAAALGRLAARRFGRDAGRWNRCMEPFRYVKGRRSTDFGGSLDPLILVASCS